MANYGGQNFTSFSGVNIKGTIALRVSGGASGSESTLSAASDDDGSRAWRFPAKSGNLTIGGTFIVHLPAITGGNWSGTSVTISGIRAEDALVCSLQDPFNTVTTERVQAFLAGATPANGGAFLTFMNPSATATIYNELIVAYAATR